MRVVFMHHFGCHAVESGHGVHRSLISFPHVIFGHDQLDSVPSVLLIQPGVGVDGDLWKGEEEEERESEFARSSRLLAFHDRRSRVLFSISVDVVVIINGIINGIINDVEIVVFVDCCCL